jgi:hypothetical protein
MLCEPLEKAARRVNETKPGISAVISTWNKAGDLRDNLEALKKQTHPRMKSSWWTITPKTGRWK